MASSCKHTHKKSPKEPRSRGGILWGPFFQVPCFPCLFGTRFYSPVSPAARFARCRLRHTDGKNFGGEKNDFDGTEINDLVGANKDFGGLNDFEGPEFDSNGEYLDGWNILGASTSRKGSTDQRLR